MQAVEVARPLGRGSKVNQRCLQRLNKEFSDRDGKLGNLSQRFCNLLFHM